MVSYYSMFFMTLVLDTIYSITISGYVGLTGVGEHVPIPTERGMQFLAPTLLLPPLSFRATSIFMRAGRSDREFRSSRPFPDTKKVLTAAGFHFAAKWAAGVQSLILTLSTYLLSASETHVFRGEIGGPNLCFPLPGPRSCDIHWLCTQRSFAAESKLLPQ